MNFIEQALDEALREFADAGHDGDILVEAIAEELKHNCLMRRELQATLKTLIILALPRAQEQEIMERGLCEQQASGIRHQASVTENGTAGNGVPALQTPMAECGETRGFDFCSRLELAHLVYAPAPEPVETSPETRFSELQHAHCEAILASCAHGNERLMRLV